MQRCIDACHNCQLVMGKYHPCSNCCYDCEQICKFTQLSHLKNSFLDISLLDLCVNACNFCILECGKHAKHHDVCKECVAACNECVIECQKLKIDSLKDTFS